MRQFLFVGFMLLISGGAWASCPGGTIAQGVDQNGSPVCVIANGGGGGGSSSGQAPTGHGSMTVFNGGGSSMPQQAVPEAEFMSQCMTHLTSLASQQLRAQLLKDKAVTTKVRTSAEIEPAQLGASCSKACSDYAYISNKISWANTVYIADSMATIYEKAAIKKLPQPPMPGQAEVASCVQPFVIANWCPKTGSGVGAGPTRQENPLDKIKVCISMGDALAQMNFTPADAAHNCARPNIVDAADRIKAEQKCVEDAKPAQAAAPAPSPSTGKPMGTTLGSVMAPSSSMLSMPIAQRKP